MAWIPEGCRCDFCGTSLHAGPPPDWWPAVCVRPEVSRADREGWDWCPADARGQAMHVCPACGPHALDAQRAKFAARVSRKVAAPVGGPDDPVVADARQAARELGVSYERVRQAVLSGAAPCQLYKFGRRYGFTRAELEALRQLLGKPKAGEG